MSSPSKKHHRPAASSRRSSVNPPLTPETASRSPSHASIQSVNSTSSGKVPSRVTSKPGLASSRKGAEPVSRKSDNILTNKDKSSAWLDDSEDDAKQERLNLVDDLKERLVKTELSSENYRKQVEVLQMKLDEALEDQSKLEYRVHEEQESVGKLIAQNKEALRQCHELENRSESEKAAAVRYKEDFQAREEELLTIIHRLKSTLAEKSRRVDKDSCDNPSEVEKRLSRQTSDAESGFTPNMTLQKDKVIETLQLELAEAQIKLVEVENIGSGRLQDLEKMLIEARMANARLIEGNESFQLLLNERSTNGGLSRDELTHCSTIQEERAASTLGSGTTLADELEHADDTDRESQRSPEVELKALKDQNKALSLYITKIIERLLNHKDFESILDKTPDLMSGQPKLNTEKELPTPPPRRESMSAGLLTRAKSVTTAPNRPRPRPMSYMPVRPSTDLPLRGNNASNTNRISLQRSNSVRSNMVVNHGQTTSDLNDQSSALTNPQHHSDSSNHDQTSPAYVSPRGNVVNPVSGLPDMATHLPSSTTSIDGHINDTKVMSPEAIVIDNNHNLESRLSTGTSSPPRMSAERAAAVMAGNKPRPLRLVQESAEAQAEQEARKKANRGSWVPGWFSKVITESEPQQKRTFSG